MATVSQRLLRMGMGFAVAQALRVAAELNVADLLQEGPRSVDDLAAAAGADARALHRVLRFLAGEGVFREERAGLFVQTELSAGLRSDLPDSPRDFIRMINSEAYTAWGELLHTAQTGETAFDHVFGAPRFAWLDEHPEAAALFQRAMVSVGVGDNDEAARAYDFSGCRLVVDVGGGHGQLLSAILARHPHLNGVLLDRPSGIEAARKGVGGPLPRCELQAGDFFAGVPAADTYLLKKVIHDWDDEKASRILANCRASMRPGGRVLVIEAIVPPGNEADPIKLLDVNMLVVTGGMERTEQDYEKLFAAAGLRLARVLPTDGAQSILEGVAT